MPLPTLAPYNATMHAVVGLTETLNAELKVCVRAIWARPCCVREWWTPRWGGTRPRSHREALPTIACRRPGRWRCEGAISPAIVAQAAIDAVEAGRVHAVVGPGADRVARQRVDALLADLD